MRTDGPASQPRRRLALPLVALGAALAAGGCPSSEDADLAIADPAAYVAEVESWRAERLEALEREDGWLSPVTLVWLEAGESTLGSGPAMDVAFPEEAPSQIGLVRVRVDRVVELELAPGVRARIGGEEVERAVLATDARGAEPSEVRLGRFRFHVLERGDRFALQVKDTEEVGRRRVERLDAFPVDPAFRVVGRVEPRPEGRIEVPSTSGDPTLEPSPGRVRFELEGEDLEVEALEDREGWLLVFADAGEDPSAPGRFVSLGTPDAKGRVIVDFNRAYNSPCAFSRAGLCPLPPAANRLPIVVEAGEKVYARPSAAGS